MNVNKYIDHTLLKPDATIDAIEEICEEAKEYEFASVCINPKYVKKAKEILEDSDVAVCTVVGFPLGANLTETKINEAKQVIKDGADEIDYVVSISDVKNGWFTQIDNEMKAFINLREEFTHIVIKVILENCYLSDEEIAAVCKIAKKNNIDFVKTSTGFGSGGATIKDLKLMRENVGESIGIKASGGIRTYDDAIQAINAGATRIGASSSVQIIKKQKDNLNAGTY